MNRVCARFFQFSVADSGPTEPAVMSEARARARVFKLVMWRGVSVTCQHGQFDTSASPQRRSHSAATEAKPSNQHKTDCNGDQRQPADFGVIAQ